MNVKYGLILIFYACSLRAFAASETSATEFPAKFYPFQPIVTYGESETVCQRVEAKYREIFSSNATSSAITHLSPYVSGKELLSNPTIEGVDWLKWRPAEVQPKYGQLLRADVEVPNLQGDLYLYWYEHSWRGHNYYVYLVEPEGESALLENIGTGRSPEAETMWTEVWPAQLGNNWSFTNPFVFDGTIFFIDETGRFLDGNGNRNVYSLEKDGTLKKHCSLLINKKSSATITSAQIPAVGTLLRAMEQVSGPGDAYCGTLQANRRAKAYGWEMASTMLVRPWVPVPEWQLSKGKDSKGQRERPMFRFLADWAMEDAWTQRTHGVMMSALERAIVDLGYYYQEQFGLDAESAKDWATRKAVDLIDAFIIEPSSYLQYRDNELLEIRNRLVSGESVDLTELTSKLSSPEPGAWGQFQRPSSWASLSIDNQENLRTALKDERYRVGVTLFGKNVLMYAAHMNHYQAVEIILSAGVGINEETTPQDGLTSCFGIPNVMGRTALMYAAENGSPELISLLLKHGADAQAKDSKGNDIAVYLDRNPRLKWMNINPTVEAVQEAATNETGWFSASFDCIKATSRIEKLTCGQKSLAIYDRELNNAFFDLLDQAPNVDAERADQRAWLKRRNQECSTGIDAQAIACLNVRNRARIAYLLERQAKN